MLRKNAVILLCLCCLSNYAMAEIYKWVDDNGGVHYSDTPVDKKAKEFHYNPSTIGDSKRPGATMNDEQRREKQKKLLQSYEVERQNREKRQASEKKQQEKRKRYCQEAKIDLRATQDSNLLYNYDKNGKRYFYNEAQRKEAIAYKKKLVEKWCD